MNDFTVYFSPYEFTSLQIDCPRLERIYLEDSTYGMFTNVLSCSLENLTALRTVVFGTNTFCNASILKLSQCLYFKSLTIGEGCFNGVQPGNLVLSRIFREKPPS